MVPGYAVLRLLWRPATIVLAAVLLLPAVVLPLALLAESVDDPLAALWSGAEVARATAWRMSILVPAALGLLLGVYRGELEATVLGHVLPGARRDVALVMAASAGVAAALAFMLVGRAGGVTASAAAAALALCWFALPGLLVDGALPKWLRWAAALLALAAVVAPLRLAGLVAWSPALAGSVGVTVAGGVMLFQSSRHLAQRRLRRSTWLLEAAYLPRAGVAEARWEEPLAEGNTGAWLRAAAYESGMRFPSSHLRAAALAAAFAHLFNMPYMLIIMAGSLFLNGGMQLSNGLSYPLDRGRRAALAFRAALLDAAAIYGAGLAGVLLLAAVRVPIVSWFVTETPQSPPLWALVGFGLALAPVAQFEAIRRAAEARRAQQHGVAHYASAIVYMVGAMIATLLASRGLPGQSPVTLAGVIVATALLVHGTHRLLLQRYFARADLARGR
jgi:hypothetical protein